METKTSFKVNFKNGIAEITYPNIMNHSSHSTISCTSIYVPGVRRGQNKCLFITSDSSYFRKENFEKHFNVLGTFFLKTQTKMFYFQNPPVLPLTTCPQTITLKIVDFDDEVKDISATATFQVIGQCRDKTLLI